MFILGSQRNLVVVAECGERPCPNCNHVTAHLLVQSKLRLTLFFVPVGTLRHKPKLMCVVCSFETPVSRADAASIVRSELNLGGDRPVQP